jgi:hypothetical protein
VSRESYGVTSSVELRIANALTLWHSGNIYMIDPNAGSLDARVDRQREASGDDGCLLLRMTSSVLALPGIDEGQKGFTIG